jgi:hypothetical protein
LKILIMKLLLCASFVIKRVLRVLVYKILSAFRALMAFFWIIKRIFVILNALRAILALYKIIFVQHVALNVMNVMD